MIIPRGGAALHELCREQAPSRSSPAASASATSSWTRAPTWPAPSTSWRTPRSSGPASAMRWTRCWCIAPSLPRFLPAVAERLAASGVELRADARRARHPAGAAARAAQVVPAGPDDFDPEWLSLVLGVKVVDALDEAIAHIQEHSTEHSDSILTNDLAQRQPLRERDQLGGGVRQRQHALHRRRPVRPRRRGGRQHAEAPRPRPDGPGGADDLQVDRHRRWACAGVTQERMKDEG